MLWCIIIVTYHVKWRDNRPMLCNWTVIADRVLENVQVFHWYRVNIAASLFLRRAPARRSYHCQLYYLTGTVRVMNPKAYHGYWSFGYKKSQELNKIMVLISCICCKLKIFVWNYENQKLKNNETDSLKIPNLTPLICGLLRCLDVHTVFLKLVRTYKNRRHLSEYYI